MTFAPSVLDAAVDAVTPMLATLAILEGNRVLIEVPLSFGDARGGIASHEPIRTIVQRAGTANAYRISRGGSVLLDGSIGDGVLTIDRTRLLPGDVVTISELKVSIT